MLTIRSLRSCLAGAALLMASVPAFAAVGIPNLTGTKTVSGNFSEGGTIIYTVTVTNNGTGPNGDNPGDEFTDVVPAALTLVSATASSGTAVADVPNRTVHWNGTLAAAGSVTITITAVINTGYRGTVVYNQGTIFFDADVNGSNESSILTDDPSVAGAQNATAFAVAAVTQVPTLSSLGILLLGLSLAGLGLLALLPRA